MILETFPSRDAFRDAAKKATVIPVAKRILADTETPVSVVARFAESADPLFLLESAEGGERWGRYSFVGVSARAHVSVFRDDVVVRQGYAESRTPHDGRPLDVLRRLMAGYTLADLPGLPRFCGGLVGYLAYEMAHFFEPRIPNRLPAEKPLAQYREEELGQMRRNFYGFDPSYHVARHHFVRKSLASWTPRHLARHRDLGWSVP